MFTKILLFTSTSLALVISWVFCMGPNPLPPSSEKKNQKKKTWNMMVMMRNERAVAGKNETLLYEVSDRDYIYPGEDDRARGTGFPTV